jgi:hypothetical protein
MMLNYKANPVVAMIVGHVTELIKTPWLVLSTVALIRADRKDIPEVMRWLSRWGRK